jgi:hypothetical protein
MAIKFQYSGPTTVNVINLMDGTLDSVLKPAVYRVAFSKFTGYFLEKEHDFFAIPEKIYGSTPKRVAKIINTFNDRKGSTGVLLTGDKGSGKTMLAKTVCNTLITTGIPIIQVNERFLGADFISFIDSLGVIVLFFDEFGKTYPIEDNNHGEEGDTQEAILSMMEGGGKSQKRLLILTENHGGDINQFLMSRPGRIYYHFKYNKLEESTIKEFLNDNHDNIGADIVEYIIDASRKMDFFSFDILQAIVEEYSRYGGGLEGIEETLNDLNIDYNKDVEIRLEVLKLVKKETQEEVEFSFMSKYVDKPNYTNNYFTIFTKDYDTIEKDNNTDYSDCKIHFRGYELKYDSKDKMVFDNGVYVLVTKISDHKPYNFNYSKM